MPNSIREAINRGNNLLMVVVTAVLGVGSITLMISENELLDKADDAFFALIGIVGVIWYLRGRNRYQFSWFPYVLILLGFVAKVLALVNEFNDPAAVGDEYGYVSLMVMMTIVSTFIILRARRINQSPELRYPAGAPIPQTGPGEDEKM